MHELSIAQNIVEIIEEKVPLADRARVTTVALRLGEFSGIVADALTFSFDIIAPESGMGNASLEIESVPLMGECHTCGTTSLLTYGVFECPSCRSRELEITSGQELQVVSISMLETGPETVHNLMKETV